jgi:hypothetical protein
MPQMPSIPYATPRMYDNSRGTDRLIDLMLRSGDATARGQAASGAIWGRAVEDVGQIAAGAVEKYGEQKAEKKQAAALDAFVASDLWAKDPKAGLAESVRILGPGKGIKFFEGLQGSLKLQNAQTPSEARAALPMIARGFLAAPEASRPTLWKGVEALLQPSGMLPPGQSLGEYKPEEHDPIIKSLAAEGVTKQKTPDEIRAEAQARAEGTAAGAPEKPVPPQSLDAQLAAASAAGDQATIARVLALKKQEAAATRAPKEPVAEKQFTFNPEGVVLSSYGVREKDAARKQAKESGLPVFENAASQAKGVTLAGIAADAKELQGLFVLPEVQAAIGAAAGRWSQLKSKFVDLPPNVQRAIQLATSLSDTELRKRSGAQINEKEMQRLLRFTTDPNRPLGHNVTAVAGLLKSAARDYQALSGLDIGGAEPASSGGNATPSDVDSLLKKHGF